MKMDLYALTQEAIATVEDTAGFVRNERARWMMADLKHKADESLVTSIDTAVEERLVERFGRMLPGSKFLAEEFNSTTRDEELMWIIDPIDGTTNMVHNLPMYCISVALVYKGKPILGIICEITSGECFWAYDGQEGAFLGDKRIKVSDAPTVKKSLIATGFPPNAFPYMDEYMGQFQRFMTETQGIRRLGSAAMDLAYVAAGRCDAFFEYCLKPWDVAAGAYIVQKAGGIVTDFSGGSDYLFGQTILASNGKTHQELLTYFEKK
jgi:myo-inositol-1(or 4)-monophosphatase